MATIFISLAFLLIFPSLSLLLQKVPKINEQYFELQDCSDILPVSLTLSLIPSLFLFSTPFGKPQCNEAFHMKIDYSPSFNAFCHLFQCMRAKDTMPRPLAAVMAKRKRENVKRGKRVIYACTL